ncbi:uncharacterized protein [Macrobrachium rosenbergii]|uniref:uncharacterized protein n=1 Tax=Macrobrachium rosenbergii TaxID=79674 RepID=UPI0034D545B9
MPSADFSSFKSHKHIVQSTQSSSDNPPVNSKPRNRFLNPPVFSETTRNLPTTRLPAWNSYQNKPPVNIESRNRYSATKAPGVTLFTEATTQDDQRTGAAYSTPSLRRRGCGARLLDRLEYLLGRELVMDQMGVGVYSAVVESILSVECGRPEESSGSAPGTTSTTSMAQISPPPPTSSISPTLGMEGWLSLDDIRKEEEEKQKLKTTTSPADGLVTKNRFPSENSLSPVAAALLATSSPVPSHPITSETPPVDSSVTSLTASLSPSDGNSSLPVEGTPLPSLNENNQSISSSSASSFSQSSPTVPDISTAPSVTSRTSALNSTLSPDADLVSSFRSLTEEPLLPSALSEESSTTESPAASAQPRSSILRDGHKLIRRAVGMAALNSLAVAKALPLDDEDQEGYLEISSRELSKNVFGFETILTALVYLSFGIFLYQMIQRAVGAEMMGSPFNNLIRNGGRSFVANGSRLLREEPIESYYAILLRALKKVPEIASKILLEEGKSLEVQAKSPSCLPLYLCRVTSRRFHQKELENETDSGSSSSIIHHALFTSAVSTAMSAWSGQNPSELIMATWTGALGLPCLFGEETCSGELQDG